MGSSTNPIYRREYGNSCRVPLQYTLTSKSRKTLQVGYREGITPGKLSTLQEGFDQAFAASVPASRMLGYLRGQASSLLAYAQSFGEDTNSALISEIRSYIQSLAQVKRTDVLPPDKEAEEHARQDHAGDGEEFMTAMNEETQHKRDVESLEAALGGLGASKQSQNNSLREQALLDSLQTRLSELKAALGFDSQTTE